MVFSLLTSLALLSVAEDTGEPNEPSPPEGLGGRALIASAIVDGALDEEAILELAGKHPDLLEISPDETEVPQLEPFAASIGMVAYYRPQTLDVAGAKLAADKLASLAKEGNEVLILDLRVPSPDGGFRDALNWIDLFLPAGDAAFFFIDSEGNTSSTRSVTAPAWEREVFVLVDKDTGNVGEVIARVLSTHDRSALVVGQQTRGRASFYSNIYLDSGEKIRFAVADVLDSEGSSVRGKGLQPSVSVDGFEDTGQKMQAFRDVSELGLEAVVKENVRPRRSEASLIKGEDPEIPYLLARTAAGEDGDIGEEFATGPKIDDATLRAAIDTSVSAVAMQLRERVEHVRRREWRISETNRKLKELREKDKGGAGNQGEKPESESGDNQK